jgi:hypothetical protein
MQKFTSEKSEDNRSLPNWEVSVFERFSILLVQKTFQKGHFILICRIFTATTFS